jgi:hypothetical protein
MNEIENCLSGIISTSYLCLLLQVFEASEIIGDKEVEIATALGNGFDSSP